jgi:methyl-accepting chemotaxis protein
MIAQGARTSASKKMADMLKDYPHIAGVRLTIRDGLVVASSHPKTIGQTNVGQRNYFRKAMQGQQNRSDLLISKTSGQPIFTIAAPVRRDDEVVGTLYAVINLADMSANFVDPIKVGQTGYGFMFNEAGIIFAYPDKQQLMKLDLTNFPFGRQMLDTHLDAFQYTYQGIEKITGIARIGDSGWRIGVTAPMDEIFAPARDLRNKLIGITAAVLVLLSGGIWVLIQQLVVALVRRVSAGLNDIVNGEGDLTRRIAVSGNDEITELAARFNAFVEQQRGIIRDIGSQAASLTHAADEMSATADQMSSGSTETQEKARRVSVAATEMSVNMDTISATTKEAATAINMLATSAEEMSATVSEIAQNAGKASSVSTDAVNKVAVTSRKVNELGTSALEISKVTEVITEISEQTNLLALNATIEAARAGEAGKGFAVVANEIKDLASQTANATQEIKSKIDGIQTSTRSTVAEISEIAGVIDTVNDLVGSIAAAVEEQAATTRSIAENVTQSDSGLQEVTRNIAQSSAVSTSIAEEIKAVDHSSTRMSANSSHIQQNAASLAGLANQLNTLVARFKV